MSSPSSRTSQSSRCCLLSNGRYSVMLGANGAGFSRWRGLAVTRWREDPVGDPWGSFFLLRDEDTGATWSATRQPYGDRMPDDAVAFADGCARFSRQHDGVRSELEVAVAADADIELRRLTLSNHGDRTRELSLTCYAELVLGPIGADDAHPAFSKMFVQTAWDAAHGMLLATRRRRDDSEAESWAAQALQIVGVEERGDEYETDRARFLGRLRALPQAQAMQPGVALSNTVGCVLDPVFALRRRFTLAPGSSVTLLLWTRIADTRDNALSLSAQLDDPAAATRLFDDATRSAWAERRRRGIDDAQAARFAHWMDAMFYSDPRQRAAPQVLAQGRGGAPVLWPAGISGDRPILLLRMADTDASARVDDVLLAQQHWQQQQLAVDVVLLHTGDDALQAALDPRVSAQQTHLKADNGLPKAELFALREDTLDEDLRQGLLTVARMVLDDASAAPAAIGEPSPTDARPASIRATETATAPVTPPDAPEFANGYGGFVDGGRAYRIELDADRPTPAPWVNVMANPGFGCMVSADGGGYAWSLNSQQNPLTPWPNDPVSDTPHDVLYLRDEESGALWSACALPIRVAGARYATTHGKGWTRFDSDAHDIDLELLQCVPTGDPVKLSRLRLRNRSSQTRQLSITGYVEWALGANGTTPAPFVVTSCDERTGALFARNRWRTDFADRVAFIDLGGASHSMTGDRREFLGSPGTVEQPRALRDGVPLSGRVGAGLDPCGALQTRIELPPDTQLDLRFLLGDADDEAAARQLVAKYRAADIDQVLDGIATQWGDLLDTVQVHTPDRALDILLNDWLPYQVASCRLWARTAYYQASGAYGFRDQLQDVMALCVSRPDLAREHLLRAAGRQFAEGDVQHWWLPPKGQGIRTKIRDDRIWLAYVAMHYVEVSGDTAVLDDMLPFLTGQAIPDGATDAFFQPGSSDDKVSVYEHCARALDASLDCGAHGLPLIGTGDWNDGMNAVGEQGRGESGWLGWFHIATINAFAPCAEQRGESDRAQRWRQHADTLRGSLEQAWDGQWYRRGYYDDGAPLGSQESDECRIDTIAQSWSVMAGIGHREHAMQAMASVDRLLVDHPHRVHRLFTPPFDHSEENPGYIKGYPPGVRENGGQYTHGAIWSIFAWAGLGDGDRAADVFNILNPIRHADSADAVERYKVEPYVACADVYSVTPHIGRGGWTWYTGSAAWLYRAGLEAMLGFHKHGNQLRIEPCIPRDWSGFHMVYQHRGKQLSTYDIDVRNPHSVCGGVKAIDMDGQTLEAGTGIPLHDDGDTHTVRIVLG